ARDRRHAVAAQAAYPRRGRRRGEPSGNSPPSRARGPRGSRGRERPRSHRAAPALERSLRRDDDGPADAAARRPGPVRAAARAAPPARGALRLRHRRPRARRDAPLSRRMRPAGGDEALRLQRPDQRDREGGGEGGLTTSGSYASRMPNRCSTPARTCSASASRSALVPPRFTSASAWRVETPAPPPVLRYPLGNPACSTSHAAGTFTPPSAGNEGIPSQRFLRSAKASADSTGFVKNEPTERVL